MLVLITRLSSLIVIQPAFLKLAIQQVAAPAKGIASTSLVGFPSSSFG
jgi:hypothetical protein